MMSLFTMIECVVAARLRVGNVGYVMTCWFRQGEFLWKC